MYSVISVYLWDTHTDQAEPNWVGQVVETPSHHIPFLEICFLDKSVWKPSMQMSHFFLNYSKLYYYQVEIGVC